MDVYQFKCWCEKAVSGILFPPDQKKVYRELMNHLYDHYDNLVEQGCDTETAQRVALEAMGDALAIAPQLAAIHRPFWGYFLRVTRMVLVLTACAAVLFLIPFLRYSDFSEPTYNRYDAYQDTYISDETGITERRFYAEPGQSAQSDGYRLTLTRAAWWHTDFADEESPELDSFHFQIEVFNPRPWAEPTDIPRWFWAEDSLGNHYYSFHEVGNYYQNPAVVGNSYHTGPFTYTHDMWLSNFCSQEAEWIDLHYYRSGRNIVFRIDLTGGDEA